jgi:glycosyltransferase involved in cell wall biosynthesis
MKIAIDVSQIVYGTGVSTYTKNLVDNLLKIDKENDYLLFGGSLRRQGELKNMLHYSTVLGGSVKTKIHPISPMLADLVWNRLHVFPIEKLVGEVDVYHSSNWAQAPSKAFKVTTVHDLVPIKYPKLSHPKLVSAHKARLKWIKNEVDRVIVPSKATYEDIQSYGIKRDRIRVISEAPDKSLKPVSKRRIEKLKRKYRIGKYFLSIGVNPRKNTKRIIDAFIKLKPKNIELVIIGRAFMNVKEVKGVKFLGHVPNNELAAFYSGAEVLLYPSLYEGFGLPILDAFACKTPVVTSKVGSMAEVAGSAAVLVDPKDTVSIAEGIQNALENKNELVKKGGERVKKYSWQKNARETLKVYNEARK